MAYLGSYIGEGPLIFQGHSVLTTAEGRKTKTRRIAKPPRGASPPLVRDPVHPARLLDRRGRSLRCPYGFPGRTEYWVREAWAAPDVPDGEVPRGAEIVWKASHAGPQLIWRSPLFMPRWASRMQLGLEELSVERLHDMTEDEARVEGAESLFAFTMGWDAINGQGAWRRNDWVWVIKYALLEWDPLRPLNHEKKGS